MRQVMGIVLGLVVAVGILIGTSYAVRATTGHHLADWVFLLAALVAFPLCIGVALTLVQRRDRQA